MSQGSGPVNFLNLDVCDMILQGLRGEDGTLPNFDSGPESPPPVLEAEVACDRGTQVDFVSVRVRTVSDQGIQALPPQLQSESSTQTLPLGPEKR